MFRFVRLSTFFAWCFAALVCGSGLVLASFYLYLAPNLPETEQLLNTQLQTPLRIYSSDNKKIAEFGEKRRTPISIDEVPESMIEAFIAAEDNRFFEHSGIDLKGLARATVQLVSTGKIVSGGSTITMQVAKNFFLSRERTFIRKFNEIFLALQIEQALTKDQILELYLNKIYLGNRAYGVHAAAEVYYGKNISELSLAEMAMIAGLPKAPSRYNPLSNAKRAKIRRNWILDRMLELGMINTDDYSTATSSPITARFHRGRSDVSAPYIAEMARLKTIELFGSDAYTSGLKVYVTTDSKRQLAAQEALKSGLESYDRRHGYRGPINSINKEQLEDPEFVEQLLRNARTPEHHEAALVLALDDNTVAALLRNGETIKLDFKHSDWVTPFITINKVGDKPTGWQDILKQGDLIQVVEQKAEAQDQHENEAETETETETSPSSIWVLSQTPEAQGALASINPIDGAIEAIVGGYDFSLSNYNRATQAKRQPGSNFKPFIYLAGLNAGNTAATLINDAPIVFDDKNLEDVWRPENSSGRFYGPTRLRKALYNSRNLVSIRLLKNTGIRQTLNTVSKFGFDASELPRDLSLALGSAAMTPLEVSQGYAMLANGGYYVEPYLVERIESSEGEVLYQADPLIVCPEPCELASNESLTNDTINTSRIAPQIADERALYILHSMLKDVIKKGTGRRALVMKRDDLAGKTGTTNDQKDAWFSGYNTALQTSVWVGFDNPSSLGRREYGAKAALPVWIDYMNVALEGIPHSDLAQPEGIVTTRINPETGELAMPGEQGAIFELFRTEYAPKAPERVISGSPEADTNQPAIRPEDIF